MPQSLKQTIIYNKKYYVDLSGTKLRSLKQDLRFQCCKLKKKIVVEKRDRLDCRE